jgi:hypothetical protein
VGWAGELRRELPLSYLLNILNGINFKNNPTAKNPVIGETVPLSQMKRGLKLTDQQYFGDVAILLPSCTRQLLYGI